MYRLRPRPGRVRLKQIFTGDVFQPFLTAVVPDDPGPFDKLVGTQKKIYPKYGQFKDKSREKAERHRIAPHVYGVADQAETAVASGGIRRQSGSY